MDKFEEIYKIQADFTDKFFKKKYNITVKEIRADNQKLIHWTKEYILSLIKEATELLDEIDWKSHTDKLSTDIRDNFLEEAVDVLKYLFGLIYIHGFTNKEIIDKFKEKSKVVDAKFEQHLLFNKIKADKNLKIACLDIDDVVLKWTESFIDYINSTTNHEISSLEDIYKKIKLNKLIKIKEDYRLSGVKREMKIIDGIHNIINYLRDNNYFIMLLTARPYSKYFRIYQDTLYCLKKNKIDYDFIMWSEEKEKLLINYFPDVKFIIEDNIHNIKTLRDAGFIVFEKNKNISFEKIIEEIEKIN